ncbi:MAG: response regulator [Gammaproteobacteria bacterium]|nr:response regulator [Gammaproteobacteria bacterium]
MMRTDNTTLNSAPYLLLVENHPALAFSWKSTLERIGFQVALACNEERALILAKSQPDLIILPIDEISLDGLKLGYDLVLMLPLK